MAINRTKPKAKGVGAGLAGMKNMDPRMLQMLLAALAGQKNEGGMPPAGGHGMPMPPQGGGMPQMPMRR